MACGIGLGRHMTRSSRCDLNSADSLGQATRALQHPIQLPIVKTFMPTDEPPASRAGPMKDAPHTEQWTSTIGSSR